MVDIGRTLKEYFDNQGVTQQSIANTMGVSKAYVNRLFTGKAKFGKEAAEKWGNQYGLRKSWLLTGEGPMLSSSPDDVITNGSHSSQAVGTGATAVNSDGVKECLEIIRQQQETMNSQIAAMNKQAETIRSQAEAIARLVERLGALGA